MFADCLGNEKLGADAIGTANENWILVPSCLQVEKTAKASYKDYISLVSVTESRIPSAASVPVRAVAFANGPMRSIKLSAESISTPLSLYVVPECSTEPGLSAYERVSETFRVSYRYLEGDISTVIGSVKMN